jgi:steroid 5-alpha reductase family enzyme
MEAFSGLPIIKTVADSADFGATVQPYLDALKTLPSQFSTDALRSITTESLIRTYIETNPVVSAFFLSLFFGVVVLVVSEANRNYSQVDRLWPILPATYTLHFNVWARQHGIPTAKLDLVLLCTAVWATRLTFNYWRRGGYQIGAEDYRWEIVKAKIGGVAMFFLNITFISFVQSVLLFLMASPGYIQLLTSRVEPELKITDVIFASIILTLVLIEFTADEQQWRKFLHSGRDTTNLSRISKGQAGVPQNRQTPSQWQVFSRRVGSRVRCIWRLVLVSPPKLCV